MSTSVSASATASFAVTPSDTTELTFKALYIGSTGDVVIKHNSSADPVTYASVPDGMILPLAGGFVMAATTASDIVAMNW